MPKYSLKSLKFGILSAILLFASEIMGTPFQFVLPKNSRDLYDLPSKRVHTNTFKKIENQGLSLTGYSLSLKESVEFFLREKGLDGQIRIISVKGSAKEVRGVKSEQYRFFMNSFPLCGYHILAIDTGLTQPFISGKIPMIKANFQTFSNADFPTKELISESIASHLDVDDDSIKFHSVDRCLSYFDDSFQPMLDVQFEAAGLPYSAFANKDNILELEGQFFSVIGQVKGYVSNPTDGTVVTKDVELVGDQYLTTEEMTTTTGSYARATSSTHQFVYQENDDEWLEANAFLHASDTYQWYKALGYEWHTEQLTLRLRQNVPNFPGDTVGSPNNALYLPGGLSGREPPVIALAEGDGYFLANLHTDADVVSHEFGHHVIFRTLRSTQQVESNGEGPTDNDNHSASLHEGLADFFTFAQSGDACLGESICPAGSNACWTRTSEVSCLRVGNSDIEYNGELYWALGNAFHQKGQVVSGLMYDILNMDTVVKDEFLKIAFYALDYLPSSSTYTDLILGLMAADREYFEGKYGCFIAKAAKGRGFTYVIDEHVESCESFNDIPDVVRDQTGFEQTGENSNSGSTKTGQENTTNIEDSGTSRTRTSKGKSGCGVISGGDSPLSSLLVILLLAAPLFVVVSPKAQRVKVRIRDQDKD